MSYIHIMFTLSNNQRLYPTKFDVIVDRKSYLITTLNLIWSWKDCNNQTCTCIYCMDIICAGCLYIIDDQQLNDVVNINKKNRIKVCLPK